MTDPQSRYFWLIVAGVVLASLVLRSIITRGRGWAEGIFGFFSGLACAALFGGIALLGDGAPEMFGLSSVFQNKESWTAAVASFSAIFGDRLAGGVLKLADKFKNDPEAWRSLLPWMQKKGDDE